MAIKSKYVKTTTQIVYVTKRQHELIHNMVKKRKKNLLFTLIVIASLLKAWQ